MRRAGMGDLEQDLKQEHLPTYPATRVNSTLTDGDVLVVIVPPDTSLKAGDMRRFPETPILLW